MKRTLQILTVLLAAGLAAPVGAAEKLSLMLDWFPNVDHLPVYVAREKGYLATAGLEVEIISPTETADALKLAAAGKVDLAVSYQPQTVIAAAAGLDVRVVGRLVGHPLTCLLFLRKSGIETPTDLAGRKIGYTVPGLMDVLLEAFARVNGVGAYQPVNVGFAIVQSLTAGKVDAVMGPFKTYETVTMSRHGLDAAYFELEKWGIPDYDELIFVAGKAAARERAGALAAFTAAVARGIAFARAHPEDALETYLKAVPEADREIEAAAFKLTLPCFAASQAHDLRRWQAFADFAHRHRLIEKKVDVRPLLSP